MLKNIICMKKLFNLFLFSGLALGCFAQSDYLYSHFMFNKLAFNPGYTGSKGSFDVSAFYRRQWSGIDGAPRTINLNAHTPFAGGKNAIGLSVSADEIGDVKTNSFDLFYAYQIKLNEKNKLSIGLQGRIEQARLNWSNASAVDRDDVAIPTANETNYAPNFGVGAYYFSGKYYVGLSVPRLLKNPLYLSNDNTGTSREGLLTYYLMAGGQLKLARQIKLMPAMLLSYNTNAPVDVDLNANLLFLDAFWIGANYRLADSFDGLVGYEFKNGMRLGMAMDFTLSKLRKFTYGSYEIMLGYTFKCKDCEVHHLRYF